MSFEKICEGIKCRILSVKPGDVVEIKIDQDIFDLDAANQICKLLTEVFPPEVSFFVSFEGIDIEVKKCQ